MENKNFFNEKGFTQQLNNCCNRNNCGMPTDKGAGKNLSTVIWGTIIGSTLSLITNAILENIKAKKKNEYEDKKTQNKMKVEENKAKSNIRKNKIINQDNLDSLRAKMEMYQEYKTHNNQLVAATCQISLRKWQDTFDSRFPMPEYSTIPHLDTILNCCPEDFRAAMLMHVSTMYGALCFPKVRAKYLDGNKQSPSLQVVIEGAQSSGKGRFKDMFNLLFERVIKSDSLKLQSESPDNIVQVIGIEVSRARFQTMLASNNGVHIYIMETEIDAVTESIKKKGGLTTELLRKAFSNENTTQNNMFTKPEARGSFPVYLNYTFTGTTKAIDRLFKEKDYEDGTASRVCFAVIPELEDQMPDFKKIKSERLSAMQDQIDEWRKKYCYQTENNGMDIPVQETIIDLSYVNKVLKQWLDTMLHSNDKVRKGISPRIACMAFRCAMVMHMMAGCPGSREWKKRRQVCDLAVYIANYCMERFLYKSSSDKEQRLKELAQCSHSVIKPKRSLTNEELGYWYSQRGKTDDKGNIIGYGTIAKILGMEKDDVRNTLKKYGKSLN